MNPNYYYTSGGGIIPPSKWPSLTPREVLPFYNLVTGTQPADPESGCWSKNGDFLNTLTSPFPKIRNRKIIRGNFSGEQVPGYFGGDNNQDPSLLMTWDLTAPRVSDLQMRLAVNYYADTASFCDIVISRPQAINQQIAVLKEQRGIDDPDNLGWWLSEEDSKLVIAAALAACIRVSLYCQAKGLNVHLVAVSDGYKFETAKSFIDSMIAAGALIDNKDTIIAAWQIDKWYSEDGVCDVLFDGAPYANQHGFMFGPHWGGGYEGWAENCACWNDITKEKYGVDSRWTFQQWFSSICNECVHYGQCNVDSDIDQVQSWIFKIIIAFNDNMIFCATEMGAQWRFDFPKSRPQRYVDLKTWYAMCSANPLGIRLCYLGGGRDWEGFIL